MSQKNIFQIFSFILIITSLATGGIFFSQPATAAMSNAVGDPTGTDVVISPASPSNLRATLVEGGILLNWNDNSNNEKGFYILRATDTCNSSFSRIATTGANSSATASYKDTTISAGHSYCYRVQAFNAAGTSGFAGNASISYVSPASPSNLKAVAQNGDVSLTWNDNSNNEDGFYILRATNTCTNSFVKIDKIGANSDTTASYKDTTANLTGNNFYCYRVQAYNKAGTSGFSGNASTKGDLSSPVDPSNLTASPAMSQIILNWNDNSNNEDGFRIMRSVNHQCLSDFYEIKRIDANSDSTASYSDFDISEGNSYCYRVQAYNKAGNSNFSGNVLVKASELIFPPNNNQPVISLWAEPTIITIGENATINWNVTKATSCTASGAWSGTKAMNGNQSVSPQANSTYTLTCSGAGGSASRSVAITVNSGNSHTPTLTFTANPLTIDRNEYSDFSWNSTYTETCAASGGWTGSKGVSGTYRIYPERTATFTLTCSGRYGSISRSQTITVRGTTPSPTPTPTNGNGGGGNGCGTACQPGTYFPPTPTPSPTIITGGGSPTNYCQNNIYAKPLHQAACRITVNGGANCKFVLPDGFSVQAIVPAQAVARDANLQFLIQDPNNLTNLATTLGSQRMVGGKIIQLIAEDPYCVLVPLTKDAVITFVYPQSYAAGFNEATFGIKNSPMKSNNWKDLANGRDIAANIVSALTSDLGYFSLFGIVGSNPVVTPTPNIPPIVFPTPTPNVINVSWGWLNGDDTGTLSYLFASLADRIKNLNISLCNVMSILNLLLLLLVAWFIFGKRLIEKESLSNQGVATLNSNGINEPTTSLGSKIKGAAIAVATAPKKGWDSYIEKKAEMIKAKKESLSIASLMPKEENKVGENLIVDEQPKTILNNGSISSSAASNNLEPRVIIREE